MQSALDPNRSVVVEACAGSGKTWLLVSRMLRLLLAGVAPSELLAITFTRKVAEEMRSRLYDWLSFMATAEASEVLAFLAERGVHPADCSDKDQAIEPVRGEAGTLSAEAEALLDKARGLFEQVLNSTPGPMITTFHGWFLNLLSRAPLARRAPANLIEEVAQLKLEAWQTWVESLRDPAQAAQAAALTGLLEALPLVSVRNLLFCVLDKRAEWWAWSVGRAAPLTEQNETLQTLCGVDADSDLAAGLRASLGLGTTLREFAGLLAENAVSSKTDATKLSALHAVLAMPESAAASDWFGRLTTVFLTQAGQPAVRKLTPTLVKRMGSARAERFVQLHEQVAATLAQMLDQMADQRGLRVNRLAMCAGTALIDRYQTLKSERDGLDFADAEWLALQLLSDPEESAALLAKLDARWKHLLLDEFQDANPMQWLILTAWLAGYGADPERPTVFMVGDPKQSIYRFRRAEPRLFELAGDWLASHYDAHTLRQNETRRCAPRVVAWVNALFGGLGVAYPGFEAHRAHQTGLPGWCELIRAPKASDALSPSTDTVQNGDSTPLTSPSPHSDGDIRLRDPLTEPPPNSPDAREAEASRVAQRILEIVGHLEVIEANNRPARFADILLLSATRTSLQVFEAAFKTAGIPFIGNRRGGLLTTLEASDLMAVLGFLVLPHDDLKLAHALKSPIFGLVDSELLAIRAAGEGTWWSRLCSLAEQADAAAQLRRAVSLLNAWRAASGHLPPHDLLDRIFHEGELEARYAAASAARIRPSVLANLRGFLELSLKLGGGRFPSLPRFVDDLMALATEAGSEAPDEPPAAFGDCVRMLTIHAAKGLEAPIVFLIKADEGRRELEHSGVLVDWPPGLSSPAHFSVYGSSGWRGTARNALFDHERALAARESLNLLYVAMTRARQSLFVSGLDDADPASWLALLSTALDQADMANLPEMPFRTPVPQDPPETGLTSQFDSTRPQPGTGAKQAAWAGIGHHRAPENPATRFGIQVHRYLELASNGTSSNAIQADLALDEAAFQAIREMAEAILGKPALQRFFKAGWARNELAFVDANGQLRRIDRLVELDDAVWVLDYKTGSHNEAYWAQLHAYRQAMVSLFPGKPILAALIYSDGSLLEMPSDYNPPPH